MNTQVTKKLCALLLASGVTLTGKLGAVENSSNQDQPKIEWIADLDEHLNSEGRRPDGSCTIGWSPDGKYFGYNGSWWRCAFLWNTENWHCEKHGVARPFWLANQASPDLKYYHRNGYGNTFRKIYSTTTELRFARLPILSIKAYGTSISKNGLLVAEASRKMAYLEEAQPGFWVSPDTVGNHNITIRQVKTGKAVTKRLTGHTKKITDLAWHPIENLTCLASSSRDNTVKIWDLRSEQCTATLDLSQFDDGAHPYINPFDDQFKPNAIGWSPCGRYLVVAYQKKAIIWDVETQKHIQVLEKHRRDIDQVSWSPCGNFIATNSMGEELIMIWDTRALAPQEQSTLKSLVLKKVLNGDAPAKISTQELKFLHNDAFDALPSQHPAIVQHYKDKLTKLLDNQQNN